MKKIIKFVWFWLTRKQRKKARLEAFLQLHGLKLVFKRNTSGYLGCFGTPKKTDGTYQLTRKSDGIIITDNIPNDIVLGQEMSRLVREANKYDVPLVRYLKGIAGSDFHIRKILQNPEEFLKNAKRLSNLKPEDALDNIMYALPHFNHSIVKGNVTRYIGDNCVNVVQVVEGFLRTGKIERAKPSKVQFIESLEDIYKETFLSYSLPSLSKVMKEGERGIIWGYKTEKIAFNTYQKRGHVFNVIKKNSSLIYPDGQRGAAAIITNGKYEGFKYIPTKKNK